MSGEGRGHLLSNPNRFKLFSPFDHRVLVPQEKSQLELMLSRAFLRNRTISSCFEAEMLGFRLKK